MPSTMGRLPSQEVFTMDRSRVRRIFRYLLAVAFVLAGANHFWKPDWCTSPPSKP
jgi:uncharacterized membrane protein